MAGPERQPNPGTEGELDPEACASIHSIDRIRLGIAEAALIGILVLGAPTLVLNIINDFKLSRPEDFGAALRLVLKPGLFMYAGGMAIYLFRRLVPVSILTALCVGMLMVVGWQSLLDLGFIGSGMLYFLMACGLAALFFDGWRLLLPLALSFLAIAAGGWLWVSGARNFYFDPAAYATSLNTYAIRLVTVLFFLAMLIGSIRAMNRFLKRSVLEQNELSKRLYRAFEDSEARYRELAASRAALEASECRYEVLVENSDDLIYSLDPEGRITALNQAFERVTGLPRREYLGRGFSELIAVFPGYAPIQACYERVRAGLKVEGGTLDYPRAEGESRMVRAVVNYLLTPVLDAEGRLVAVTGSHHDITKLVLAEEEARASAAALEQSLAEKTTLLREIHHRVKNNFQIIDSLLSLQADQDPENRIAAAIRDPRARIQSMALVHESLYRSRNLASIDFAAYTRELVAEIETSLSGGGVQVEVEAEPFELDLDRSILCGLILNELVSNAFKHAFRFRGEGERRLRVAFKRSGAELLLAVEDNGTGIGTAGRREGSHSLGLDLVEGLALQLHGTIAYSNGSGTKALLRFPIEV